MVLSYIGIPSTCEKADVIDHYIVRITYTICSIESLIISTGLGSLLALSAFVVLLRTAYYAVVIESISLQAYALR